MRIKNIFAAILPALLLSFLAIQMTLPASAYLMKINGVGDGHIEINRGGSASPDVDVDKNYSQGDYIYCDTLVTDAGVVSSWDSEWQWESGINHNTYVTITINAYPNAPNNPNDHSATVYADGLYYGERVSGNFIIHVNS